MKTRIAHLTSVHPRFDTRIFFKECQSLLRSGYDVTLIVADGKGNEIRDGVKVLDVGKAEGRLTRVFLTTRQVLKKALNLDCEVYHLHDPELIPVGLRLKALGKKVVFDLHEDVSTQILGKKYLNMPIRRFLSLIYLIVERFSSQKFDAVIAATPYITKKIERFCNRVINVNNFPVLAEIENGKKWSERKNQACYVGVLCEIRGLREMIAASKFFSNGYTLKIAGHFYDKKLEGETIESCFGKPVKFLGFLKRSEVKGLLAESQVGLVTLHPLKNYLDSLPVKMFEYMAAGLPVVASDFPYWRKILEENDCGISVDPLSPEKIAEAVNWLMDNPRKAEKMGVNGKNAVQKHFNWSNEENKLIGLYSELLAAKKR